MKLALSPRRRPGPVRAALVNPPFQYFPGMKRAAANYARPPLGIAYLAGYAREYASSPVELSLFDLIQHGGMPREEMAALILDTQPDVVGFSAVTGTIREVERLTALLKEARPDLIVLVGGPHVTALPREHHPGVDVNFNGECEKSFLALLEGLADGGIHDPLPGSHQLVGGEWVSGPAANLLDDLDAVPFPARDLLPKDAYFHSYPQEGGRRFTTFFTSRGCPFDCNFCGNEAIYERRVRYHSFDRVRAEIDHVVRDLDMGLVFFDDDTFTANRKRARTICEYIRNEHPRLRWVCHTRADTLDRDLVFEMKASGCVEMQIGVESGDETIMKKTDKRLSLESVRDSFGWFREAGIKGWATFIVGNLDETPATVKRTISFAKEIDAAYASFIVLLPFPGTRTYTELKRRGHLLTEDWADYSWHGQPVFETPELSWQDLIRLRRRAYMAFYLRPRKLWSVFLDTVRTGRVRETLRNFRAWRSLVTMSARRPDSVAEGVRGVADPSPAAG